MNRKYISIYYNWLYIQTNTNKFYDEQTSRLNDVDIIKKTNIIYHFKLFFILLTRLYLYKLK